MAISAAAHDFSEPQVPCPDRVWSSFLSRSESRQGPVLTYYSDDLWLPLRFDMIWLNLRCIFQKPLSGSCSKRDLLIQLIHVSFVPLRFLQSHGEPSWRTEQVLKGVYKAVISAQREMIIVKSSTMSMDVISHADFTTSKPHVYWDFASPTSVNGTTSMVYQRAWDGVWRTGHGQHFATQCLAVHAGSACASWLRTSLESGCPTSSQRPWQDQLCTHCPAVMMAIVLDSAVRGASLKASECQNIYICWTSSSGTIWHGRKGRWLDPRLVHHFPI